MIKIFLAALFLLVAPHKVYCQDSIYKTPVPKLSLRFNFLGLADPIDNHLSFGLEKHFHSNWSAGSDAGWVFHSAYARSIKETNGLLVRPFIRYYTSPGKNFWEAELHYKYVAYTIEDWIGRMPVNNVPSYEEFTRFKLNKHATGIHFKYGGQSNLSPDKKFKLEYTIGTGVRFKRHKVPGGIYNTRGLFNDASTETYIGPLLLMSFRFVYVLK
jgi:hypothetical protein